MKKLVYWLITGVVIMVITSFMFDTLVGLIGIMNWLAAGYLYGRAIE